MVVRTIKDTTNMSFVKIAPFTSTPYTKIVKREKTEFFYLFILSVLIFFVTLHAAYTQS